jgi:hypothetical protein
MSIPTESTTAPVADAERGLRASDAEREATVATLHHALGAGRLDLAETETRVATAYAARYRSELPELVADLPAEPSDRESAAPTWADVWTTMVWRARVAVYGPTQARPTGAQRRAAAVLAVLALVWMLTCALFGAALVAW